MSAFVKCTDSIMNSKLFCLLVCVFASQLIKPSPFTSCGVLLFLTFCGFKFYDILGTKSKENSHQVFSARKGPLIDNNQSTNYKMTVYFTVHTVTHPSC